MKHWITRSARWKRSAAIIAVGLIGTGALAVTAVSSSLGGFSATVTNSASGAGSGTLLLSEGSGSTVCLSTGTGTTSSTSISSNVNPSCPITFSGSSNLEPGGTAATTTINLQNTGSLPSSSLTLGTTACSAAGNPTPGALTGNTYFGTDIAGFCGKVDVTVEQVIGGSTYHCVFPTASSSACAAPSSTGTLDTLAATTALPGIASQGTATYQFTTNLDTAATNADQGLTATIPLTWTLNQ